MTVFSSTDAAFAGFRLVRERPGTIVLWAVFQILAEILLGVLLILMAGSKLTAGELTGQFDWAAILKEMGLGPLILILLLAVMLDAVIRTAIYRALFEPQSTAWGALRLGADELRMGGLNLVLAAATVVYVFVVMFVLILAANLIAGPGGTANGLVGAIAALISIPALVYPFVRISLAQAVTFREKKIRPFRSWEITKGRFWPLFGAYVLMGAVLTVAWLLAMMMLAALVGAFAVATGGDLSQVGPVMSGATNTLPARLLPMVLVAWVAQAVITAAALAVLLAPSAEAYHVFADEPGPAALPLH